MKRLPLVALAALGLTTLAACGGGGGGGDEDAFCDALEALSEQVEDGDLASEDGLEDATETANDLQESAADGDQLDAVRTVLEEVSSVDPDDAADAAETIQDELGDFAEDCDIDEDEFAVAPTTTTTEPVETTTTTTEGGGDTTTTAGGGGDEVEVLARQPVPGDIAAEFAGLAQACFDGDMTACDELFNTTPSGSADEAYGDTCAGRITDGQGFDLECADVITGPAEVPADVVDQATAAACQGGDMVACDDLFRAATAGTPDQLYGGLCGFRVQDTNAFCVDIFGDVAFA